MIGCAYHCRACNGCFGSLVAFDAHRQFEEGHRDDWGYRVCVEPLDDPRFAAKTEHGVCRLARPEKTDTPVWTMRASYEKYHQRNDVSAVAGLEDAA